LEKGKVKGGGRVKGGGKRGKVKGRKRGRFKMVGKRLKGKGRVSMVKGVEGVLPISLPGVKKLLHNINTHRYCVPKTIKLFGFPIF
jgi:hypothetical protein